MFVDTTLKVKYIRYDPVTVSLFHESYPFHISFIFKQLKRENCTAAFTSRDKLTSFAILMWLWRDGQGDTASIAIFSFTILCKKKWKKNYTSRHQLIRTDEILQAERRQNMH